MTSICSLCLPLFGHVATSQIFWHSRSFSPFLIQRLVKPEKNQQRPEDNLRWTLFVCVCVFRVGMGPCLHLPSVYIVICLMRRDRSFVNEHEGGGNEVCVCVTSGGIIIETCVADRLMGVMTTLVWRTNSRSSSTRVEYKNNLWKRSFHYCCCCCCPLKLSDCMQQFPDIISKLQK